MPQLRAAQRNPRGNRGGASKIGLLNLVSLFDGLQVGLIYSRGHGDAPLAGNGFASLCRKHSLREWIPCAQRTCPASEAIPPPAERSDGVPAQPWRFMQRLNTTRVLTT